MKKLTKDTFIEKSKKIHNNKYIYSLIEYINNRTKIEITCPIHGVFLQTPDHHMRGFGCSSCSDKKRLTTEIFIKRAQEIHNNKYDYSLTNYVNSHTKVKIICPLHNVFEKTHDSHIGQKQGCPICSKIETSEARKLTTNSFIKKAKKIHGNKYVYDNVIYGKNNKTKIDIICPKHGVFNTKPNNHLCGYGCPICSSSKGELFILNFLVENKIEHIRQHVFYNCKDKNPLRFDFYIPKYNMCIEYDGIQHFKSLIFFGGDEGLIERQHKDKIKNKFCLKHNINLIRIKHTDENINDILNNIITIEKVNNISNLTLSR